MLQPHRRPSEEYTPSAKRCDGSGQRIIIDITPAAWNQAVLAADSTVTGRRGTKVLPKPMLQAAPALSQITPHPIRAEQARQDFRAHQDRCQACQGTATDRDGNPLRCHDGERLAHLFLRLLRQDRNRRALQLFFARERQRFDRKYKRQAAGKRRAEWKAVLPSVRAADTQRTQVPAGDRPREARSVPMEPLQPQA
jgi:hypothetical protein